MSKCLRELTKPIAIFIAHLERSGCRASWLFPAFEALEKYLSVWSDSIITRMHFDEGTIEMVKDAFGARWRGDGQLCGLYRDQYLFAMITDPTTTVDVVDLPPRWDEGCRKVVILKRFYSVTQDGAWGEDVGRFQESIQAPQGSTVGKYHIQVVADEQLSSLAVQPHTLWRIKYSRDFPKLAEPSIRVAVMATQSADVERVCKVHKLIHTKSRNRLKNKNVRLLLYCYVNLRLLKSMDLQHEDKKLDAEDELEDFLDQAILLNTEPDPDDADGDDEGEEEDDGSDGD
jgi:hypothetical protein